MRAQGLRDLAKEEIQQRLMDAEEELFNLNMKRRAQKLDNPLRLRVLRRDIARMHTILREHVLGLSQLAASGKILDAKGAQSSEKQESKE